MAFSIQTNISALIALTNFEKASAELDNVSKVISTGLNITSSEDDSSNFSIAQGIRGEVKSIDAVIRGINNAKGIAKVAISGATAVSNLLQDIRQKVTEGANPANTAAQQVLIQNDYASLLQQIRQFMENSEFNGVNILIETNVPFNTIVGDVNDVAVLNDLQGRSITLEGQRLDLSYALLLQEDINTPANASQTLTVLLQEERRVNNALASLGSNFRALEQQTEYLEILKDVTETGLGNIVDADMARASAKLISSQVQKELAAQTVSVANQNPQIFLGLFENQ
ncbi:flagellin [Alphaproteobacteria bacterium]|nr:flagellin [Alphaproteobacteria bacterium]